MPMAAGGKGKGSDADSAGSGSGIDPDELIKRLQDSVAASTAMFQKSLATLQTGRVLPGNHMYAMSTYDYNGTYIDN